VAVSGGPPGRRNREGQTVLGHRGGAIRLGGRHDPVQPRSRGRRDRPQRGGHRDDHDQVTHAAIGDGSDEATLRKLGCSNFDAVVVAIGDNLEANILATVAAKSVGAKHVISKVPSTLAARVLAKVGADEVIRPEHDMGTRVAKQLAT
jgi:voltage-gated potassium channel Kch